MPLSKFPEDPNSILVSQPEADALAAFWADTNQNPWRCSFTNLSDIGHATNVFGTAALGGLTPFEREAFFRNAVGLFNTRQQYFHVLLFAQTTRIVAQIGEREIAGVRAVAEVWRDPLPNAEGRHPYVVRSLKILNNE
jgi:hypothetical protein